MSLLGFVLLHARAQALELHVRAGELPLQRAHLFVRYSLFRQERLDLRLRGFGGSRQLRDAERLLLKRRLEF